MLIIEEIWSEASCLQQMLQGKHSILLHDVYLCDISHGFHLNTELILNILLNYNLSRGTNRILESQVFVRK